MVPKRSLQNITKTLSFQFKWINLAITGAWSGIDTLANFNKVEHAKIWKYNEILKQERENFENPPTYMGVACYTVPLRCEWLKKNMPYTGL